MSIVRHLNKFSRSKTFLKEIQQKPNRIHNKSSLQINVATMLEGKIHLSFISTHEQWHYRFFFPSRSFSPPFIYNLCTYIYILWTFFSLNKWYKRILTFKQIHCLLLFLSFRKRTEVFMRFWKNNLLSKLNE